MKRVMVQYKVMPDRAAEKEELVRVVYDELHRTNPTGIQYATFKLEDGLTFIQLAFEADDGQASLPDLRARDRHIRSFRRCESASLRRVRT